MLASYSLVRVGPGRAFGLALRSRLFRRANPFTARAEELQRLRESLALKKKDQYVVVTGPKGVGKTVFVRSATATCGVVDVEVEPGALDEQILHDAYSAIAKPAITFSSIGYKGPALRVLWFYNLFARHPPTIVFHLKERSHFEAFAKITGAVRTLANDGFTVIVDSSTHAAPDILLKTGRQIVFLLDYMSAVEVSRVDEYKSLFETLEKYGLVALVWEVIGGNPVILNKLCTASVAGDVEQNVFQILKACIEDAECECASVLNEHADAIKIFQHFKENKELHLAGTPPWLATDTKVFRLNKCYFVPKSPTHVFTLRHRHKNLQTCTLESLKGMASTKAD